MSKQKYNCVVSGKVIPKERVAALKMLGTPENMWTCVEHSATKPRQGIFLGETGTSELLMVNRVYNDTLRSVFKGSDKAAVSDDSHQASDDTKDVASDKAEPTYKNDELSYYTDADDQSGATKAAQIMKGHEP